MMAPRRSVSALGAALAALLLALPGCETEDPTRVLVENGYPEASKLVVYKVWWEVTLFTEPVLPGGTSSEQRGVPQADTAYALLAPGWDPESGTPPTTFLPLKSKALLRVSRGDTLRIDVSDATFFGNCAANQALTQEDADFITTRIFPGELANTRYDAATCTAARAPDGG